MTTALPGKIRLSMPARVASDATAFKKSLDVLMERMGCPTCFSGADCAFQIERDFVMDERLNLVGKADESLAAGAKINVTLPAKVGGNLDAVKGAIDRVLKDLGCPSCCSGFDIQFQLERQMNLGGG